MNNQHQIVWITGAASGIGKALAFEYAGKGATVILSDRDENALNEVVTACNSGGGKGISAPFDLSKPQEIQETANKIIADFPSIDILISNGGISQRSLAIETPVEIDRKIMEINFFGAITLTKAILPALIANGGGDIAVTSSITGKFGFPLRTAYCASKHATQGFFEALRAELYPHNVGITIVSPGRVKTNISINALTKEGKSHGVMDPGQAGGITPEKCAVKIIRAIRRKRKEILLGGPSVIMVHIRRFFPPLYHRLVRKVHAT